MGILNYKWLNIQTDQSQSHSRHLENNALIRTITPNAMLSKLRLAWHPPESWHNSLTELMSSNSRQVWQKLDPITKSYTWFLLRCHPLHTMKPGLQLLPSSPINKFLENKIWLPTIKHPLGGIFKVKGGSSIWRHMDNCSSVSKVKILQICMHSMWFYKLRNLEQVIIWTVNVITASRPADLRKMKWREKHLNSHKGTTLSCV